MPVTIREATAADTEPLTPLFRSALAEFAPFPSSELPADFELSFRRWLGRMFEDPRSTVLVAVDTAQSPPSSTDSSQLATAEAAQPDAGSLLLGYLLASVHSTPPTFHPHEYALIHHLYVLPGSRRRGIGRRLVTAARHFYAALNLPQLEVHTRATNDAAHAFLQSLGFEPSTLTLSLPLSADGTKP